MFKTANNMIATSEKVVFNAVRERKLAYVRGQGLVEREGAIRKRVPTIEAQRVELAKRARLLRSNPDALGVREQLIPMPEVSYEDVGPDQRNLCKARKFKGKRIARTLRY